MSCYVTYKLYTYYLYRFILEEYIIYNERLKYCKDYRKNMEVLKLSVIKFGQLRNPQNPTNSTDFLQLNLPAQVCNFIVC